MGNKKGPLVLTIIVRVGEYFPHFLVGNRKASPSWTEESSIILMIGAALSSLRSRKQKGRSDRQTRRIPSPPFYCKMAFESQG